MATTIQGRVRGTPTSEIFSGDVQRTRYTVTYLINSDSPSTDDDKVVLETSGLPSLGDTWVGAGGSTDGNASVISMRARQDRRRSGTWLVDVDYDSDIDIGQGGQGGGGGGGASPTDLSPELEYDYETIELEAEFDAFNKFLTTSAGEPFPDTKVVLQRPITVVVFSRWETNHPAVVQQTYMNRCNSTPFSGAGEYSVLMAGIRARLRPVIGTRLWWTTYKMKWDPQQWYLRKLDIGSFAGSVAAPIFKYVDGRLVDSHLDGFGNHVGGGHGAAIRQFRPYGIVDFNTLGF